MRCAPTLWAHVMQRAWVGRVSVGAGEVYGDHEVDLRARLKVVQEAGANLCVARRRASTTMYREGWLILMPTNMAWWETGGRRAQTMDRRLPELAVLRADLQRRRGLA